HGREACRSREMTRVHYSALAAVLALAACGDAKKPPPPTNVPAAVPSVPKIEAAAQPQVAPVEWVYTSVGKRDPFKSFLSDNENTNQSVRSQCTTPLGRFEVDQLRLVAVVTGLDDPVAMVEAPNGVGYSLRRGACIGRNGGVITAVRGGEVVISEWTV